MLRMGPMTVCFVLVHISCNRKVDLFGNACMPPFAKTKPSPFETVGAGKGGRHLKLVTETGRGCETT